MLVRRLHAVEALGAVQTVCLDKTGTLTVNRMRVVEVMAGTRRVRMASGDLRESTEDLRRLISLAVLCNDARIEGSGDGVVLSGSATEGALLDLARKAGLDIDALRALRPTVQSAYRTEGRPYMATLHGAGPGRRLLAVKGSPSHVLELCTQYCVDGIARVLSADERSRIASDNALMAGRGLRVLGFAYRVLGEAETSHVVEPSELVWAGLAGIADPLRDGAADVVAQLRRAGVKTAIITGDQARTAAAIAAQLRLAGNGTLNVMEASELDQVAPECLASRVGDVNVFARVSPSQKLQVVQALQRAGRAVAMTGDGINDGPALRCADVGVAMGNGGTELVRSVADVVLEDDELMSLMVAIRHGRTTYDNLRKSIHFLLATNLSEIEVMLSCALIGGPAPLNPMQLLWINLVSDIFPGLALAMDPPEPDVLERAPRDPAAPIVDMADAKRLAQQASLISAGALGAYAFVALRSGAGPRAGSAAFMALTSGQLLHALSARSQRHGLFNRGAERPNPLLAAATGSSLVLQGLASIAPWTRQLLRVTPLSAVELAVCSAGAVLPLLGNEAAKLRAARSERQ